MLAKRWHTVVSAFSFCWLADVFKCVSPFENPDYFSLYCTHRQEAVENLDRAPKSSSDFAFVSELWIHRYYASETYTSKQNRPKWLDSKSFMLLLQIATIPATIAASPSSNWTAAPMGSYRRSRRICWMTRLRQTQMWWEEICCTHKVYMIVLLFYWFEESLIVIKD